MIPDEGLTLALTHCRKCHDSKDWQRFNVSMWPLLLHYAFMPMSMQQARLRRFATLGIDWVAYMEFAVQPPLLPPPPSPQARKHFDGERTTTAAISSRHPDADAVYYQDPSSTKPFFINWQLQTSWNRDKSTGIYRDGCMSVKRTTGVSVAMDLICH